MVLEKYYVGCKYKATTWYSKKNQNAPRPSEHSLVKTKQRQCSTPSSMFLTFSVLVANPKKTTVLYTVANPALGLLNREERKNKSDNYGFLSLCVEIA